MITVKDSRIDSQEAINNFNRSYPLSVQVLSGIDEQIDSSTPPFFRYLNDLSNDQQALPMIRTQAMRLVFYYYDRPQFLRLVDIYVQQPGAIGEFWYNVINQFSGIDGSLGGISETFHGAIAGLKAWNVGRGDKKIKEFENNLANAQKNNDQAEIAKWQRKLDDQNIRQHRRIENYQNTVAKASDERREKLNNKYGFNDAFFNRHQANYEATKNHLSELTSSLLSKHNINPNSTVPKVNTGQENVKGGSASTSSSNFDWSNFGSSLLDTAGSITSSILQNQAADKMAEAVRQSANSGVNVGGGPFMPSLSSLANQSMPSVPAQLPNTGNPLIDSALSNAARIAQASVPFLAPPPATAPSYGPAYSAPVPNPPIPQQPGAGVKAGFDTKKLLMIGGGVVALGALFFLMRSRRGGRGLAGIEESEPSADYSKPLSVLPID